MDLERILSADHPAFERAFRLYEASFPVHEQRTRDKQEGVLCRPEYHYEIIWEDGAFAGLLLYWEAADFHYVEHFAITPELRGRKLGSKVLAELSRQGKDVILEIDPPEDEVSVRRKRFYEKLGFCANPWLHVHPPYCPKFSGHELVVMTRPGQWEKERYDRFFSYLRHTVMADCE